MKQKREPLLKQILLPAWVLPAFLLFCGCSGGSGSGGGWGPESDENPGLPPYVSVSPEDTGDGWPVSTPDIEGMDGDRLLSALEKIRDNRYLNPGVDSVVIASNGQLVAEAYFNGYGPDTLHDLRSASKSITSALAGIAVEQGVLSTQDTLEELITNLDHYNNPDARKSAIRVIDLLNMSSGLDCNDWDGSSPGNEENMYRTFDWIKFVLDLPMAATPGERGRYCTGGVVLLGNILSTRSGMGLDDFAGMYLFGPLGIQNVKWRRSPDGQATGGGGMRLRPRDAARFGQLYLNKGVWGDQRVIAEQWTEASRQRATTLARDGYGLLWWKREFQVRKETQEAFFASGNGGNYIFLFPLESLVVVFTGSNYNSPLGDQPFDILSNRILPTLY